MAMLPNPFATTQAQVAAPGVVQPTAANPYPSVTSVPQVTPQAMGEVSKVAANNINVTPDQTVEGRTQGLIAQNSPLMQLAETRANQASNSRGLINSSMAVGAGQTAVMDAATNIAKQDAQTSANAAQLNTQAANTAQLANQDIDYKTSSANAAAANAAQGANQEASLKVAQGNLSVAAAASVADIEAQYKNLTQASSSAASIMNTTAQMVNSIMTNEKLDAAAKTKAIADYNANAVKSLKLIGALAGDVELSSFLTGVLDPTPTPTPTPTPAPAPAPAPAPSSPLSGFLSRLRGR